MTVTRKKSVQSTSGNILNGAMSMIRNQAVSYNHTGDGFPGLNRNGNGVTAGMRFYPNAGGPDQAIPGPRMPRPSNGFVPALAAGTTPAAGTLGGEAWLGKDVDTAKPRINLKLAIQRPPGFKTGQAFPYGVWLFRQRAPEGQAVHMIEPSVVLSMNQLATKMADDYQWFQILKQNGLRDFSILGAHKPIEELAPHEQYNMRLESMRDEASSQLYRPGDNMEGRLCYVSDFTDNWRTLGPFVTPGAQSSGNSSTGSQTYRTRGKRSGAETIAYTAKGEFERLINIYGPRVMCGTHLIIMVTKEQYVNKNLPLNQQVTSPLVFETFSSTVLPRPLKFTNPHYNDDFMAYDGETQLRIAPMLLARGLPPITDFFRVFGEVYDDKYEDSNVGCAGGYRDAGFMEIEVVYSERTGVVDYRLRWDEAAIIPVGLVDKVHWMPGACITDDDVHAAMTEEDENYFKYVQKVASLSVIIGNF